MSPTAKVKSAQMAPNSRLSPLKKKQSIAKRAVEKNEKFENSSPSDDLDTDTFAFYGETTFGLTN